MNGTRPPYRLAAVAVLVVLAGYLITLAPTVTLWDAGEFLAAAKTLGIPHPPATPLFVLIAHVWGIVVPIGSYAWRLNLLSAVCGALAAGCWFLVAHEAVERQHAEIDGESRRILARCAGAAAALLTAFGYTTWQNSTETEVYSAAMLTIALAAWLALRWRARRTTPQGPRLLLVILFLGAMSVGNHLMALLAGPAVVAALATEAHANPRAQPATRRAEWAQIAVVAAAWLLLIALGLGSALLTLVTGALAVVAAVFAVRSRQVAFSLTALLIVLVGVSPYLFVLLRAQQHPWLNEADPATWHGVIDVIRRAQYPVRTPLDDPTVMHGMMNPGRTLTILGYQLANYAQYFDWQWARSVGAPFGPSPVRLAVTLLMATLGIHGAFAQRRGDPASFWLVCTLFAVTGLGLVIYMNFKPGPSIGWNVWRDLAQHEVRDRDYFFVGSFVAWGVWVAIGLTDIVRSLIPKVRQSMRGAMLSLFAVALLPAILNFRSATRRQIRDATFARDFAISLLQSAPPHAILFTWGDNDTFPLWYLQAVEGLRRDVTVICLALAETPWYVKELRDAPAEPVDLAALPAVWRGNVGVAAAGALHDLTDSAIDAFQPLRTNRGLSITLPNGDTVHVAAGTALYGKDLLLLHVLQQNAGRRPVAWSVTASDGMFDLGPRLIQQGMALVMPAGLVDSSRLMGGNVSGAGGALLDVATTRQLMDQTWSFGAMLHGNPQALDPDVLALARVAATPMTQVGVALIRRGDTASGVTELRRAVALSGDSTAIVALRVIRSVRPGGPAGKP